MIFEIGNFLHRRYACAAGDQGTVLFSFNEEEKMKIRLIRLGILFSLFIILITAGMSLSPSAQAGPVAQTVATVTPVSPGPRLPARQSSSQNVSPSLVAMEGIAPQSCTNLIQDPSFETTDYNN